MGNVFYYLDEHGRKRDEALHAELLDNPEADERLARQAIERQLATGTRLEATVRLYGTPRMREALARGGRPSNRLCGAAPAGNGVPWVSSVPTTPPHLATSSAPRGGMEFSDCEDYREAA